MEIKVKDKTYNNLSEFAEDTQIIGRHDGEIKDNAKRVKHSSKNSAIIYKGKTYPSLSAFTNEFGLRYPATVSQFARGLTPEQIIERQRVRQNKSENSGIACEYNGVTYKSLSDAADSLGIPVGYIYTIKKRKEMTASEALALAVESYKALESNIPEKTQNLEARDINEERNVGRGSGKRKKTIIDGVEYASHAAAVKAYKIPIVTVTTRMRRYGLTFEEALSLGSKERRRIPIILSQFSIEKLKPIEKNSFSEYEEYFNKLTSYGYHPDFYLNSDTESLVIRIQETFKITSDIRNDVYIVLEDSTIEIIVVDLLTNIKNTSIYDDINKWNAKYVGPKFWYNQNRSSVFASWNAYGKSKTKDLPALWGTLFSLFSVCDEVVCEYTK